MTKYYSREHEWIDIQDNNEALIGITSFAIEQLGDIVFVELPKEGATIEAGKDCAVIESVKAASEIYAPMSGSVLTANEEIETSPEKIQSDGSAWFLRVQLSNMEEAKALMDETTYENYVASL